MNEKILYLVLTVTLLVISGHISGHAQTKQPKTVRDFFNLLPAKYFEIGCCGAHDEPDSLIAHTKYLETFLRVEDTANGYLEGGCDGGQSCITMALFKKPDGTYVVAIHTASTMYDENFFLEYRNGRWYDVAARAVPRFSKNNGYRLPRHGTKVEVFSTKVVERISSTQVIRSQGPKLYDLVWKNGRFTIRKWWQLTRGSGLISWSLECAHWFWIPANPFSIRAGFTLCHR